MPKKGKEVKAPPPPPPTKNDFEMMLTLIYKQLGVVRGQIAKSENLNEKSRNKLRDFLVDRKDITSYLNRNLEEKNNTLDEVYEQIKGIGKLREADKKELTSIIKDLEIKFKHTRVTLTGEINILRSKLDTLEEFRADRDAFMYQLHKQETDFIDRDIKGTEELYNMQRKNMIEKDNLRKKIEYKIDQLCEDFEKTNEIRIAGYSRKLIRNNISLTRTLGAMMAKQSAMEVEHNAIASKYKHLVDSYTVKETKQARLERTCLSQVDIMDKLNTKLIVLKTEHFSLLTFKNLYEKSFDENLNCKNTFATITKKLVNLAQSAKLIAVEKEKLAKVIELDANRIIQFQEKIKILKNIVNTAIVNKKACADKVISLRERDNQRRQLLQMLSEVIASDEIFEPPRPEVSMAVLEPTEKVHISREEIVRFVKPTKVVVKAKEVKELANIIPEPIDIGADPLIDAVSGTLLILSSDEESLPPEEDEGGMGEAEDFGASSSESAAGMPEESEEKIVSVEVISEKSASSSTIEYVEEEDYLYEDYEENEDD